MINRNKYEGQLPIIFFRPVGVNRDAPLFQKPLASPGSANPGKNGPDGAVRQCHEPD